MMQRSYFATVAPELERGPMIPGPSSAYPVQYRLGAAAEETMPRRTAGMWIFGVGTAALLAGFAIGYTLR